MNVATGLLPVACINASAPGIPDLIIATMCVTVNVIAIDMGKTVMEPIAMVRLLQVNVRLILQNAADILTGLVATSSQVYLSLQRCEWLHQYRHMNTSYCGQLKELILLV